MKESSNKIVSIIVVTQGKNNYLEACLASLQKQTYPYREVIVIDNSLDPGLLRRISRDYPFVKLYVSKENLFYCSSLNIGIKMSCGEFVLCLNDDVTLDEKYIEEALKSFVIDERIGMVNGKILRSDKKTLDSTGLFLSIWRTAEERGYGRQDKGRYEEGEYVFGVNGAVAFYRKDMLEEASTGEEYFDTDFHIFYEDLDIAWRGRRFGWRGYYNPKAVAYHVRGGTVRTASGIDKPHARRYLNDALSLDLVKNRYLAIIKNESFGNFILYLPFFCLYDALVFGYLLFFKPYLLRNILAEPKYIKNAFMKRRFIKEKLVKNRIFPTDKKNLTKTACCDKN